MGVNEESEEIWEIEVSWELRSMTLEDAHDMVSRARFATQRPRED